MKIGADPEFFIRDTRSGGVKPICGLLGGTKAKPKELPGAPDGCYMQEDNVMGEFNIPPTADPDAFTRLINSSLKAITWYLQDVDPHIELDKSSARLFDESLLTTKAAREFGCSPDYNSYEGEGRVIPQIKPEDLAEGNGQWRFAGGHVHLGYDVKVPPFVMANLADVYIGLSSIGHDKQGPRRALYGQPGRFRPKPYGIEYRTLSNFWIFQHFYCNSVAAGAWQLLNYIKAKEIKQIQATYSEIPWKDVQNAITNEDEYLAVSIHDYCMDELKMRVSE